jgi:nucleoside-diphosphate-sugar epimerase
MKISIIGCGWLGLPLLKELVASGYQLNGTSRSEATLANITAAGGRAFSMALPEEPPTALFDGVDVVILTLPPGGRQFGAEATKVYLSILRSLEKYLTGSKAPHLIYTSSTGVYGEAKGLIDEASPTAPNTHSGHAVVAAEQWLMGRMKGLTILRLAGLLGGSRHPGNFYGGRERKIPSADAPVNLVQRADVIAAVKTILKNDLPSGIFNVCASSHPPKGEFYTTAAESLGLTVDGTLAGGAENKVIISNELRLLGWIPVYDDLSIPDPD